MVGQDLNKYFKEGDIFQLQSDGAYCLICDSQSPKLDGLVKNNVFLMEGAVLLMNSIPMLTSHFRIHPRVETILEFHLRTIDLSIKDAPEDWNLYLRSNGQLVVRLTKDPVLQNFIHETDRPGILFIQSKPLEELSIEDTGLQDRFKNLADHHISPKKTDGDFKVPLVSMDENGELIFKV